MCRPLQVTLLCLCAAKQAVLGCERVRQPSQSGQACSCESGVGQAGRGRKDPAQGVQEVQTVLPGSGRWLQWLSLNNDGTLNLLSSCAPVAVDSSQSQYGDVTPESVANLEAECKVRLCHACVVVAWARVHGCNAKPQHYQEVTATLKGLVSSRKSVQHGRE